MHAESNGARIHYELDGPAEAPVLMLSHSLGSSSIMWEPQLPTLREHYRVLRFDTRGHGASDAPQGAYTLEQLADDAVAVLDAAEVESVHFVGLSMGGMIAQGLALSHRDRVRSMTLCDTMALVPEDAQPVWQERIDTARSDGMGALADPTMERWFTAPFREAQPEAVQPIRAQFLDTPAAGYIGCCEAIRRLDYLGRLGSVDLPTHVIVGEHDPATPVEASRAIHEAVPGAGLTILSDAAHMSNIEQPQEFDRTLLTFLKQLA